MLSLLICSQRELTFLFFELQDTSHSSPSNARTLSQQAPSFSLQQKLPSQPQLLPGFRVTLLGLAERLDLGREGELPCLVLQFLDGTSSFSERKKYSLEG